MSRTLGACLLLSIALTACATEPSPCETAAAQLTACSDDQRDAFIASCEESGLTDTAALSAEDATEVCTAAPDDGKTDQATLALRGLCVAGMYAVKWSVALRSPTGLPLSASSKQTLRPLFGDLVEDVRISLPAKLPPGITIAGHRVSVEPGAQTFGNNIYIRDTVAEDPEFLFYTVIHEMTHARQAKAAGGFYGFAQQYCASMIAVGFDYNKISQEIEAYRVSSDAETNMNRCGHLICP